MCIFNLPLLSTKKKTTSKHQLQTSNFEIANITRKNNNKPMVSRNFHSSWRSRKQVKTFSQNRAQADYQTQRVDDYIFVEKVSPNRKQTSLLNENTESVIIVEGKLWGLDCAITQSLHLLAGWNQALSFPQIRFYITNFNLSQILLQAAVRKMSTWKCCRLLTSFELFSRGKGWFFVTKFQCFESSSLN